MAEIRMVGYEDEDGVKISGGAGFVASGVLGMLSPEQQELARRGEARELKEAEAEAAERRDRLEGRLWQLNQQGAGRSHYDVIAAASAQGDIADRVEARRERRALEHEQMEEAPERLNRWTFLREAEEKAAADAVTPASKADLAALASKVTSTTSKAALAANDVGLVKQALRRILGRG